MVERTNWGKRKVGRDGTGGASSKVTIPSALTRAKNINVGDRVLFTTNEQGEIVLKLPEVKQNDY